jgi:hypothetical protein
MQSKGKDVRLLLILIYKCVEIMLLYFKLLKWIKYFSEDEVDI